MSESKSNFKKDGVIYDVPADLLDTYSALHVCGLARMDLDKAGNDFLDCLEELIMLREKLRLVTSLGSLGGWHASSAEGERQAVSQIELCYIQDARSYCGNSVMWWRVNGEGYTSNLEEAWKVPVTWRGRDTDRLWPCDVIDAQATRQFDMQLLRGRQPLNPSQAE